MDQTQLNSSPVFPSSSDFHCRCRALLAGAGMLAFVHWKHEGDFRPLYTPWRPKTLPPWCRSCERPAWSTGWRKRRHRTGALGETGGIAAGLAAAGLPKTGRIGFELFDKTNFGATEFVEHINYKRALEGELERSVMSLAEVEQARVHLTLPKESVFLDQQQPAKASVMVKLRPGAQISPQNVMAVTNLVASAVEGLNPEAVSVVDMDGKLLSRPQSGRRRVAPRSAVRPLELRQQIERDLVAKISATLEPLLGRGGFRAGASVDCDLTSGEQQEETLDPTHSVMVSSQKTEDVTERAQFRRSSGNGLEPAAIRRPARQGSMAAYRAAPRTSPIRPAVWSGTRRFPRGRQANVTGGPGGSGRHMGRTRRRAASSAGSATARNAQDDQGPGRGRYRVQRGARRSTDCRNPALREHSEYTAATAARKPAGAPAGGEASGMAGSPPAVSNDRWIHLSRPHRRFHTDATRHCQESQEEAPHPPGRDAKRTRGAGSPNPIESGRSCSHLRPAKSPHMVLRTRRPPAKIEPSLPTGFAFWRSASRRSRPMCSECGSRTERPDPINPSCYKPPPR